MKSCIYKGDIRHRRFEPVPHEFEFPLFMMYLDLEELPEVFEQHALWSAKRPAVAWFRRADHVGADDEPLDESVRGLVHERIHLWPTGPIRLLTHLRYFGYGFNPVSFYYCFDDADTEVVAVAAEINNTPWGEQYCYVVAGVECREMQKDFHISPFMPMEQIYAWRFTAPGKHLSVHMESRVDSDTIFDATLSLRREPIEGHSLNKMLFTYPLMTLQVMARIYGQAAKLWWKNCPYFPHPSARETGARKTRSPEIR